MPIWRLQVTVAGDTAFPRDRATITPHFNDAGALTNPQNLCDDLATAMATYYGGTTREVTVTAYDAQGTVPVEPQGYAVRNLGLAPAATVPREIACCLSFMSQVNRPSYRGRLYIPVYAIAGASASMAARPGTSLRNQIATLVPILTGLGGADVDWCVFSRKLNEANPVSHWWIDDEWDTIRSRGMRATSRITGTASE